MFGCVHLTGMHQFPFGCDCWASTAVYSAGKAFLQKPSHAKCPISDNQESKKCPLFAIAGLKLLWASSGLPGSMVVKTAAAKAKAAAKVVKVATAGDA